ncbi:MAG: condensation domain-containing protein, partial [Acidobacteriaceae bacterium]
MSTLMDLSNPMKEETAAGDVYAMPATPLQVRLWNLEGIQGGDPAWNVAVRFRLLGQLDREKLERALQLLIGRHEVLRTSLDVHNNSVVERIAGRATLPVEWCDLRSLTPDEQAEDALRLSTAHARQLLPLTSAPLLRVRMLRLADDEHLMMWNLHHAVCDGWSVGLLAQDLMECYGQLLAGREPAAKDSLDYGDYAVWLDEYRRTTEYETHRNYWKGQLSGSKIGELPLSWRCSKPSEPMIHSTVLSKELTDRLVAIAHRHGATFFHTVLAAFSAWMRLQQNSAEVVIGTPVSGRDQSELESVVGTFVNYIPLRVRVDREMQFVELLHSVRDQVTDSLEHAAFRFEDMLSDLETPGAPVLEMNRLFSVAFICQQDFVRPVRAGEVALSAMPSISAGAVRPLTVFMVERADGWRLSCEVDNRTVSAAQGATILEDFQRLLAAVSTRAEEALPLLIARAGLVLPVPDISDEARGNGQEFQPEEGAASGEVSLSASRRVPATEAQFRFCMLDRLKPGDTSFDLEIRMELEGTLSIDALKTAAGQLVARNEILRTTLEEEDGRVWQIIHPQGTVDFRFLPILFGSEAASTPPLVDDRKDGFSLSTGPLFRVRVRQLQEERYRLEITLSHAIADGWSSGLFLEQLHKAYEESLSGTRDEAEQLPAQFSSYSAEEQQLLASAEKDRRLEWWRQQLDGAWAPLSLPQDIAQRVPQKGNAATISEELPRAAMSSIVLPSSVVHSARLFAKESNTTLFAVFGAVFQALLARYSGQEQVLFVTPFANRTVETETVLGSLAIPVCLPGRVASQTTFRQLVEELSDQLMGAVEHALPLGLVAPLMDMRVVRGYHPLNQITFFYQRAFVHDMDWQGVSVRSLPDLPAATGSEWQLGVVERGDVVSAEFQYDATLYSEQTMDLVGHHYARLLACAAMEPDTAMSQLQFISAEERALDSAGQPMLPVTQCVSSHKKTSMSKATVPQPERYSGFLDLSQDLSQKDLSQKGLSQNEQTMLRIWEHIFKTGDITVESDFFDLGGHSLLLARLQIAVKKEFNVAVTAADVFRNPTVAELTEWLNRANTTTIAVERPLEDPRIVPIQPLGTDRPLFVISQSMIFRTMATELGQSQPV